MDAKFLAAVQAVLALEGGYVDHPDDPGKATNYGISQRSHPGIDVAALTREKAIRIYYERYWAPIYLQIEDPRILNRVFDLAVNTGPLQGHLIVQRAANSLGAGIEEDGIFGPATLAAVNGLDPERLLDRIKLAQIAYYVELAAAKKRFRTFLIGWLRRALG